MRIRVILILLFIIIISLFQSSEAQKKKSFLWEIIPVDGPSSYLLGSIHVMKPGIYPLKPVILNAFTSCDLLAVEMDVSRGRYTPKTTLNSQQWKNSKNSYRAQERREYKNQRKSAYSNRTKAMQSHLAKIAKQQEQSYRDKQRQEYKQKLLQRDTRSFQQRLQEQNKKMGMESMSQKLKMKLGQLGISYDLVKNYPPWTIRNIISSATLKKLGYYSEYGIDLHFMKKAYWANKKIVELENQQIRNAIQQNITSDEQEEYLLYSVDRLESMERTFLQTVDAWAAGDTNAMLTAINDAQGDDAPPIVAKINKRMLEDRNRVMTKTIIEILQSGKTIFAVAGTAHMVGPNSIVQLLREKGYEVVQR